MNAASALVVCAPRPATIIVGRDDELGRMRAAHVDVPVAIIYGIAGVGKSTLALAYASRWTGPVAYVNVHAALTIAELADAIHQSLSVVRHDVARDDGERLAEMWADIERCGCLAIIDDLHLLPPATQHAIVNTGAHALRRARLVAVSRELIPISSCKPDRLQLRLDALDCSSARILWERLIELYGPGHDFQTAWLRSRGNPLLLRQAHRATLPEQHPLEASVRGLRPDERRLANVFAVARRRLPRDAVMRLPIPGVSHAMHVLMIRLIVDVTPDEQYQMHDLWREVVTGELDRDARQMASADLVVALQDSTLDPLARVLETAWHLRYLGRHAEVGALLLAHSADLVRRGATADLLHEIDELPANELTADLLVLRARTLARGMQIRRAHQDLRGLLDAGNPAPQVRFFLASSATLIGRFDDAHRILQELADGAALALDLRQLARLGLAWNHVNRGAMADARALLDELETTAPQPRSRTLPLRLFMLALEGQHERAADLAVDWLRWVRDSPEGLRSRQVTPFLAATMLAAAGRFAEADEVVQRIEDSVHAPAESIELAWTRMWIRCERGERIAPLAYFRDVQRVLERGGHLVGAVWTRAVTCRLLFVLGRRQQALAALAEIKDTCDRYRTAAYDQIIAAVAAEDPLSPDWLAHVPAVPAGNAEGATRLRVKAVLRLACRGWPVAGDALPRPAIPEGSDHGFDRALLELAHAVVARQRGQCRVEAQRLRIALAHATSASVDDDLVPRLYEVLLDSAALTGSRPGHDEPGHALVIDGAHHEIRSGGNRIALGARRTIRCLLYALAGAPSNHLTRATIARLLWGADYDPRRHDSTINSNIRRLRLLLAGIAAVHSEQDGYHLVLPDDTLFISPVVSP
jgi:tetratricopeptide (TPR) repeat protein